MKEGQKVVITDAQSREFQGRVIHMTDSFITVQQKRDRVDVAFSEIVAIDRPKDPLGNGALIGLAVGAAVGGTLALSSGSNQSASPFCGMGVWDDCGRHSVLAPVVAGGVLGTIIGASVDALIRHDRQLYRRHGSTLVASPSFSRRGAAAIVAVTW